MPDDNLAIDETFDAIVVGAGASGCVLASRLSEIAGKRVLLIEAGPDAPPGLEHPDIRDPYPVASTNPRFFWTGLIGETGARSGDGKTRASTPYLQGFGVGGGSNVNGMFADRGLPADYDEWRDLGAAGWSWVDVLPYFKKLEQDFDFAGPLHGQRGPIPIRRTPPEKWSAFAKALTLAFGRRGAALFGDSNGETRDGVSAVPMNCLSDRRVSASMAYLTEPVRQRPNLTIIANTMVERLEIQGNTVRGITTRAQAGATTVSAPEVIVACGAVYSPALLLRSGIGPAERLRSLGIQIVRDLPGVGRNLQNHPVVPLVMYLQRAGRQGPHQRAPLQILLRYSSRSAGCAEHDMLLLPVNQVAWHSLGRNMAAIGILVQKAYSTGTVELASVDPAVAPTVRFNLLDDDRDFERLVKGLRMALETLDDEDVRAVRYEVFVPNADIGAHLATRSAWNGWQAWMIATALRIGPLRRAVLRRNAIDLRAMSQDENGLRAYVRQYAQATYHVCGTCTMGQGDDPNAVVDSDCRVFGVGGLRVVDASVFPKVPRACTHLSVLMVAEKMADRIKADWIARPSGGGKDNRRAG